MGQGLHEFLDVRELHKLCELCVRPVFSFIDSVEAILSDTMAWAECKSCAGSLMVHRTLGKL